MATYYVNTTGGNDSNPGTLASPWLTMAKATTTVAAGDIVNFTGTFNEVLSITTTAGTEASPITFCALGTWTIDAQNTRATCVTWNKNNCILKGAICTGATTRCLDFTAAVANFTVTDCSLAKGAGAGTIAVGSSTFNAINTFRFLRNTFNGFTGNPFITALNAGLWLGNEFIGCGTFAAGSYYNGLRLIRNRFRGGSGDAIQIGTNCNDVLLQNNSFYGYTGGACVKFTNNPPTSNLGLICDNIFQGGTYAVDSPALSGGILLERNAYYGQTTAQRNNVNAGTGDVTLTGTPYTNAGSGDLSLNTGPGGGALCRGAALGGGALGALEPAAGGGGGSSAIRINEGLIQGRRRP